MNSNNIIAKLQNLTKYLSIASLGLGIFNTISNQTTLQTLRTDLEQERKISFDLTSKINNLANKDNLNQNIEINNTKLDLLTNKINNIIEYKLSDETSLTEIKKSMNEINNDLVEIINKIDDSINNNFIGLDIINQLQTYYNKIKLFPVFCFNSFKCFYFYLFIFNFFS
uniref:Uncharacterized protein n=1 Tax=Butyriboletus roseoflavus TaxID=1325616 RepID=A0A8K1ZR03_9AGAM|nr:hypothetical protein [Butyriboletus roseoflavus]